MLSFSGATFVLFVSLPLSASFFVSVSFSFCFFGNVSFYKYFCTFTIFSLYRDYIVHFFLPDSVFLPCDHGLDF